MLLIKSRASSTSEDSLSCFLPSSSFCVLMSASDLFILPSFECTSRANASDPNPLTLAVASNWFSASSRSGLAPLSVDQSKRIQNSESFLSDAAVGYFGDAAEAE